MLVRTMTAAAAAMLIAIAGTTASAMPQKDFEAWKTGFTEARTALFQGGSATQESYAALQKEHMAKLDFAAMKPSQIAEVEGLGLLQGASAETHADMFGAMQQAIGPFMDDTGVEGYSAHAVRAQLKLEFDVGEVDGAEALRSAVRHPGLAKALGEQANASGVASLLYTYAYRAPEAVRKELAPDILALVPVIEKGASPTALFALDPVYNTLAQNTGDDHKSQLEKFRVAAIAQIDANLAKDNAEDVNQALKRVRTNLEMAPKIAKLVGAPAPELSFTWSNTDQPIASLADLRGKVVVLDFWATWCGPCVSSFPNIKELQEFYDGYAVEIVGVTSPQGSVISKANGRLTAESPEHEYELMADYIDEMDISWTIAFSSQPVFNPEYGVRGIPHVAIIDPNGVLRYRGLHPAHPMAGKVEKINGLLKEFGLPAPDDSTLKDDKPTG